MSAIWSYHAGHLFDLVNHNKATEVFLYLEHLMLFPDDIQDEIIEDISKLPHCNNEAVAKIFTGYNTCHIDWR